MLARAAGGIPRTRRLQALQTWQREHSCWIGNRAPPQARFGVRAATGVLGPEDGPEHGGRALWRWVTERVCQRWPRRSPMLRYLLWSPRLS